MMRNVITRQGKHLLVGIAAIAASYAQADLITLTTGNPAFDDLERAAARANQSAFDALTPLCVNGPGPTCNAVQFGVFESTRELVHTANDLEGTGPVAFSLRLDATGLGDALRWTAAEEVTAQSSIATKFTNGQAANLNNRITALRFGATGFSIAGLSGAPSGTIAGIGHSDTAGAAADGEAISKLGGFSNGTFGIGDHEPTTFEDAFDFDNTEVTFGFDYRFTDRWVGGVVFGYSETEVDFDGSKSIVDGGILSDGYSFGLFGLYSGDSFYASASASYQAMSFEINRFIKYPSLNPNVPSTDTQTQGSTDSDAYTGSINVGYMFRFGPGASKRYVLEPYVRGDFLEVRVDSFTEIETDGDGIPEYFNLNVRGQSFRSMEVALGLRASAAVSFRWGVLFPFIRGEWHREFEDDNLTTNSNYDIGISGLTPFLLRNEDVDTEYGTGVIGVQTILRGGRQRELGGRIGDRLSLFVEYRSVFGLENVNNDLISGGLRYVF